MTEFHIDYASSPFYDEDLPKHFPKRGTSIVIKTFGDIDDLICRLGYPIIVQMDHWEPFWLNMRFDEVEDRSIDDTHLKNKRWILIYNDRLS